jgi:trans-aconitate methyltransferase
LTAGLVSEAGTARTIGVDVQRYASWDAHANPRVSLIEADLSFGGVLPPESVDLVVSNAVFEHVSRPLRMFDALYAVLKPGGQAWLRMNLYRARNASHLYRQVIFRGRTCFSRTRCVRPFTASITGT